MKTMKFSLFAVLALVLAFSGCPSPSGSDNPPPPPPTPPYTDPTTPLTPVPFTWNGSSETMQAYSGLSGVPAWEGFSALSGQNTDVKKTGDTIEVATGKTADILLVVLDGGWRLGEVISSVSQGSYTISGALASLSYEVYSKNGSTWYKVGSSYYVPLDTRTNFNTSWSLLGFSSNPAVGVVTAMGDRWDDAQAVGATLFYNFAANPAYVGNDPAYSPPLFFKYASVYDRDPRIGFFVKDNDLVIWGRTESNTHDIDFDVAVIKNSGVDAGYGWITTVPNKSYSTALTRSTISILSLTDNKFANEAALGSDYDVYIIVRKTSRITSGWNANHITDNLSDRNVILAFPTPY